MELEARQVAATDEPLIPKLRAEAALEELVDPPDSSVAADRAQQAAGHERQPAQGPRFEEEEDEGSGDIEGVFGLESPVGIGAIVSDLFHFVNQVCCFKKADMTTMRRFEADLYYKTTCTCCVRRMTGESGWRQCQMAGER